MDPTTYVCVCVCVCIYIYIYICERFLKLSFLLLLLLRYSFLNLYLRSLRIGWKCFVISDLGILCNSTKTCWRRKYTVIANRCCLSYKKDSVASCTCRVASHASFISFKQNIIKGTRRGFSRCQQFTSLRDESEVLIPTEEFVGDLGLCLLRGKPTVPFSVTSNRCIPVKSTLDWSTVTFCTCGIITYLLHSAESFLRS